MGLGKRTKPKPRPRRWPHKTKPIKTGLTKMAENRMDESRLHAPKSIVTRAMMKLIPTLSALKWLMADTSDELKPSPPRAVSWRAAGTTTLIRVPILAAQRYNPEIANLIGRTKYGPQWAAAQRLTRLASRLQAPGWLEPSCCLVPVPADPCRLVQRGFHLPSLLCRVLARHWGLSCDLSRLIKGQSSPTFASLGREQRLLELRGLIRQSSGNTPGGKAAETRRTAKLVVLVGDVLTTGATASVCAQALQPGR